MLQKPVLTSDEAATIIEAARAEADRNGWVVSIAVCDEGGHLLALRRLQGATPASARMCQSKAETAALMRRETKLVEDMINQGRVSFLSAPHLTGMLEGGVPIMVEGHCVGAVGVSGVKSVEDAQIARAGIAAVLPA